MEEKYSKPKETIGDLILKTQHKNKIIQMIRKEHEYFLTEATIRQDKFDEIVSKKLKSEPQNFLGKDFISMGTQTTFDVRNVSPVTESIVNTIWPQVVNKTCKANVSM